MYGIGPKLPVTILKTTGFQTTQTIRENTQQNIKNILLTAPGERVMDPNFGVGVRNFLFENFTEKSRLLSRIENQINKYMPFVEIKHLDVRPSPSDHLIHIHLEYVVSNILSEETLSLSIEPKLGN